MLSGDTITHSSANDDGGAIYEDGTGALTISGPPSQEASLMARRRDL